MIDNNMQSKTPVTILSGALGAGKTTTVNHLLSNAGERDLAVLVNDMGEVNIDADLLAGGTDVAADGSIAELSNGCICCELQDDLATAVRRLANERSFDHLIVESSGISEPAPVAQLFATDSAAAALYKVDALVTVVDATRVLDAFDDDGVIERATAPDAEERPLADLLVEQIECANVVLLNKCDCSTETELDRAETLIRGLQPSVQIHRTTFGQIDPDAMLGIGAFDMGELAELPGWQQALEDHGHDSEHNHDDHGHDGNEHRHNGEDDHDHEHSHGDGNHDHDHNHRHPDEVYGIESFVYRTSTPLHPERIQSVLADLPDTVVRAKGPMWIAGRDDIQLNYHKAGPVTRIEASGPWIASLPAAQQELYRSNHPDLRWDDEHGDRRTELVFIGSAIDEQSLREQLKECEVSGEEPADPPSELPSAEDEAVSLR